MLTAGHCGDVAAHWNSRTATQQGGSIPVISTRIDLDNDSDVSFYIANAQVDADFFSAENGFRSVLGLESRSNMEGDIVCHFGITSGYSCGTITDTNHDPNFDSCSGSFLGVSTGCANEFIKVEGDSVVSCRGDSGGPWFNTNTAYGIHLSGSHVDDDPDTCSPADTNHVTFQAIDQALGDLNLSLLVSAE